MTIANASEPAARDPDSVAVDVLPATVAASETSDTINNKPPGHSPSGSLSSLSSSDSTENLIKSLSMGKLNLDGETGTAQTIQSIAASPVETGVTPAGALLPKNSNTPKPIKFTVRKVSRDTIAIPDSTKLKGTKQREYAYGNIPENREKAKERKQGDKLSQLQQNQHKYDQYAARIDKINKEVDFLTNLLPPYNVEIDYVTRTKITKAIEKLRMKQDEIEKKKYSLGISISRLWREHDENEIFVRSVSKQ